MIDISNRKIKIATYEVVKDDGEEIDYNIFANVNFHSKSITFEVCVYNHWAGIDNEFIFEKDDIDDCMKEIEDILKKYHKDNTKNGQDT